MKNAHQNAHQHQLKTIIIGGAIILVGVAGFFIYQNRVFISDWFSSLSFAATTEYTALENAIDLTDSAKITLRATHPSLESRDDFNRNCDSHDEDVSILGCFTNNRIYIYNVTADALKGVRESTMSHELLHALWERLPDAEKSTVSKQLTDVYNDEKYHALLAADLELYPESERIDELHSRVGTEIADLPSDLETYYAKYFKDQDKIVSYYNSYIAPFNELENRAEALLAKYETMSAEIDEKTKAYYADAEKLSADIDEFNNCANTAGCFATDYAFRVARNALIARQDALSETYESLNNLIIECNKIADEYNDIAVRGKALESLINSNSIVEEIK